jgi:hypothetical protein
MTSKPKPKLKVRFITTEGTAIETSARQNDKGELVFDHPIQLSAGTYTIEIKEQE